MTGGSPYFGPSVSNSSVTTGVLTVFDLLDGGTNKTTTLVTFTATNDKTSNRTISSATFLATAAGGTRTLQGGSAGFVIGAGATGGGSITYTYVATGTTAVSSARVYAFKDNSSATLTVVGPGVAPVAGMTNTGSTFYLVGSGSPSIGVTITNTGTGNKAVKIVSGGETLNNLNGSISTVSGFTGGGSSVTLGDAFGGPAASQTFTFTPTGITTKGQVVTGSAVATFSNGIGFTNASGSLTATLTGTGVAPVNAVTSTSSLLARVGTSTGATVSVTNVGDGNKSGLGTISNLNGTYTSTLGTGFTGGGAGSVSLAHSNSTTLGFTFSPVSCGTSSATARPTASPTVTRQARICRKPSPPRLPRKALGRNSKASTTSSPTHPRPWPVPPQPVRVPQSIWLRSASTRFRPSFFIFRISRRIPMAATPA